MSGAGVETADTGGQPAPAGRGRVLLLRAGMLLLAFLLVHTLLFEVYVVHGASMEPALHEADRVLVWKPSRAFGRGDLAVFAHPFDDERVLVKRIVGLPGETVELRAGRVYVNDRELAETYLARDEDRSPALGRPPVKVPAGSYYLLGDNRANSQDSRTFGPLDGRRIVGRAAVVIWPPRALR